MAALQRAKSGKRIRGGCGNAAAARRGLLSTTLELLGAVDAKTGQADEDIYGELKVGWGGEGGGRGGGYVGIPTTTYTHVLWLVCAYVLWLVRTYASLGRLLEEVVRSFLAG